MFQLNTDRDKYKRLQERQQNHRETLNITQGQAHNACLFCFTLKNGKIMSYGLRALFYVNKEDEEPKYAVEIKGIILPYQMINEYDFEDVFISEGYVDYMLEVTKDDLFEIVIGYYGEDLTGYMTDINPELLCVVFEGDECERICLWIYEYD